MTKMTQIPGRFISPTTTWSKSGTFTSFGQTSTRKLLKPQKNESNLVKGQGPRYKTLW